MERPINPLLYYLLKGSLHTLSLLPLTLLYVLSDLLYPIVYYVVRYRRRIVRKNLTNSFPEKSTKEVGKIERDFYHFFCDYTVETIKQLSMSEAEMKRRMQFDGLDEIGKTLENRNLCFVYLGHYGNWEWIASLQLWTELYCAQLYHPLRNPYSNRLFYEMRSRFGGENIPKKDTLRRIVTLNNEGRKSIVGFISDQTPRWASIHKWVTFLHQDTPVFTGTERIGKRMDAVVFFADMRRVKRGYYHCSFRKMTEDIRAYPDYELTELYMKELEKCIREQPAFWLWSHNRWKRQRNTEETKD